MAVAPPVPLPQLTHRLPSLADIYFFYFTRCFAFSLTSEPGPRLNFAETVNSEFFAERICPERLVFLLSLELSELSTPQAEVIRLSYQDLDHVIREATLTANPRKDTDNEDEK